MFTCSYGVVYIMDRLYTTIYVRSIFHRILCLCTLININLINVHKIVGTALGLLISFYIVYKER